MRWFKFLDPSGQDWYVQASDPAAALALAKQRLGERGYGATDIYNTRIDTEMQGFDMTDPKFGGRVYYSGAAGSTSGTGSTGGTGTTGGTGGTGGGGTGSTGGGTATIGGIVGYNPEDPYSSLADQYRAAQGAKLGRPLDQSMFRSQIGQQAAPYATAFAARGALGDFQGNDDPLLYQKNVLQNNPNDAYGQSADAFQRLLALASGGGQQNQLDTANQYLNPDVQSQEQLGNVAQLGLDASRSKYGAWSSAFMPGAQTYVNRFRSSMPEAGMDTAGRFLTFLKSQLGI